MSLGSIEIPAAKLAGQRIAVLGKSGSGKTNTLGVIAEEWAAAGFPLTVIDPMYQFGSLPGAIRAGRRKDADIEIHAGNAADLAELSIKERVSVLLDMSLYKDAEALDILTRYLNALWGMLFDQETPQPYMLVIDEAQMYAPQNSSTPLSPIIIDLAKRGRHKNLTTVVATQRAASIVKDFLTQATMLLAHRLTFGVDTAVLREQLPLAEKELNAMMRKLVTGQALVMGDPGLVDAEDYLIAQIRKRTYAPGAEPAAIVPGAVRSLDKDLKEALKKLAAKPVEKPVSDEKAGLLQRIADLEALLLLAQNEKERLEAALKVASSISIHHPDMIGEMQVGRMVVAAGTSLTPSIQVGKAESIPATLPANGSSLSIEPILVKRQEDALRKAISRQQKLFDGFVNRFRALQVYQRLAVMFLFESSQKLTAEELGRRLGYQTKTMQYLGPAVKMGLLGKDKLRYFSTVRQMLTNDYPDLNADEMVNKLFEGERTKVR